MMRALPFAASAFIAAFLQAFPSLCVAADAPPALSGMVSSQEEGAMEGVVVSARRDGASITVSVVSDAQGRYGFPQAKLAPGHYTLAIRAAGYELAAAAAAEIEPGKPARSDLALRQARNLSAQLSSAEWLASMPGSDKQKSFLTGCTGCHTLERIVKSTHDAQEFLQIFDRMAGYYPGSMPIHPQRLEILRGASFGPAMQASADFLASVNLSRTTSWDYPLKTLPRPSGRATRVVITEYDLPRRTMEPHDVILDAEGIAWFSNFGELSLGRLDPRTGKVSEYPIPEIKKGFPTGALDLEADHEGNLWLALMFQAGIAKFDRKTEKISTWSVPAEWQSSRTQQSQMAPNFANVDGRIWVKNSEKNVIYRFDPVAGSFVTLGEPKDPKTGRALSPYGVIADHRNNLWLLDYGAADVAKIDAQTHEITVYPTPTPNSKPRRGRIDAEDRLWFAEFGGNAIGMFDPKTETIREWKVPTAWTVPYDVVRDRRGDAWTASMFSDRVTRLDPGTGAFVEYLLPRQTNMRRVFVDDTTERPSFWAGSVHGASIIKLEPLD
jgi:virginiamycin B lyase